MAGTEPWLQLAKGSNRAIAAGVDRQKSAKSGLFCSGLEDVY